MFAGEEENKHRLEVNYFSYYLLDRVLHGCLLSYIINFTFKSDIIF